MSEWDKVFGHFDTDPLVDLPPGYTVRQEPLIGYAFLNAHGMVIEQHPKDNNAIRALVWHKYPQTCDLTDGDSQHA